MEGEEEGSKGNRAMKYENNKVKNKGKIVWTERRKWGIKRKRRGKRRSKIE